MATRPAHFISDPDGNFHPTENARSRWGDDMLNGPAVVSLAAFTLEQRFGLPEFLPARLTVDLFKAARRVPTTVRVRLIRDGRRIRNSECDVLQGEAIVARATMVQYRLSEPPPGEEWMAHTEFTPAGRWRPARLLHRQRRCRLARRRGGRAPEHVPQTRLPLPDRCGRRSRHHPFVRTVVVAEATSLVSNLGTKGIGYINGDLTVALSRLPQSEHIGVQGDSHWTSEGISVGAGTLFDDAGPFATGLVTAIANPAAQIDFSKPDTIPTLNV